MQPIPDKGYGLVAATTITRGTRILSEAPLFRVPRTGSSRDRIRDSIVHTVANLPEKQRQAFISLHNSFGDEDGEELGRVRTNALPLGPDATAGGIFLNSSRINHSCKPNSQNTWNENLQKLTIHATRDIAKDEEITIFYLSTIQNRDARSLELQKNFHFSCSCSLCSLSPDQQKISDERCDEIKRLDDSIGDGVGILYTPLQTLHDVHKLLNLLESEGFTDSSIPRAYYDAFQITVTHGDIARAKIFAERAASARITVEGEDSQATQRMESLAKDPHQHRAYGETEKWRTTEDQIPKDLSQDEFARWLWRKVDESIQYADLRSDIYFPLFHDLPGEHTIDMEFLETSDGFNYSPRKHWCFLATITDIENFIRLRLIVKDKNGHELPVAFYTDRKGSELDPSSIQEGFTVAILYAEQHGFLDCSTGIRHETPTALKVVSRSP